MIKIKIKKVYTFWWKTLICADAPQVVINHDGFGRPTIAFKLTTGEYLYIGAERIKEMRWMPDKDTKEVDHGTTVRGGNNKTGAEPVS